MCRCFTPAPERLTLPLIEVANATAHRVPDARKEHMETPVLINPFDL
jgi:hypothetical protein